MSAGRTTPELVRRYAVSVKDLGLTPEEWSPELEAALRTAHTRRFEMWRAATDPKDIAWDRRVLVNLAAELAAMTPPSALAA